MMSNIAWNRYFKLFLKSELVFIRKTFILAVCSRDAETSMFVEVFLYETSIFVDLILIFLHLLFVSMVYIKVIQFKFIK